jgi:TRAP-type C4-dicarboxylate transport system permease small subunit
MAVRLDRVHRLMRRVCAIGAGTSMAGLFAIIFVNALRRYAIGRSFEWGEELPIYLAIYGITFGSALAYLQDRHVRFTLFVDFLPESLRQRLFAAVDIAVAITGGVLAWSGFLLVERRGAVEAAGLIGEARDYAALTGFRWIEAFGHLAVWQSAICVGGLLLAIAGVLNFAGRLAGPTGREA